MECGRADIEAAAEALDRHGLIFWAKIFCQYGELREKSFVQEKRRAVREGNYDLVHKLYRNQPFFGRRKVGGNEDVESSLSCRSKVVQSLMRNSGYRKLDTLLPTRNVLGEEWLEI